MLAVPVFQAHMQIALIRVNNKPPLDVMVAN